MARFVIATLFFFPILCYIFKMKFKPKIFVPIFLLVALGGYFFYSEFASTKIQEIPYSEFFKNVEEKKISSAEISESEIIFTDLFGKKFKTKNPESPLLNEFLLKNDVDVKAQKNFSQIVSLVLDIIFYAIFFGAAIFAFRKFISPNSFKIVRRTGVNFSDIIGMDSLKRDTVQIMQIMKSPEKFAKRGIRMPKGILLEGAPGNGKTLFARALAGEANVNFIPAKATDFESMFMAIGPAKVKMLFRKARRYAPCIVFIDEFDGIGTRRNYSGSAIETENTRIVTALLNELDGFEANSGVLVIAATNSVRALDEALIRPGRFDAIFSVPFPDESSRKELVKKYSAKKNPSAECTVQKLAAMFNGFSCAKIESVLNKAALIAAQNSREQFSLDDVRSAISTLARG